MIFTVGRITVRLRYQKSLAVDDIFLIFAVVCLTAALGLLFAYLSSLFELELLLVDPQTAHSIDINRILLWLRRVSTAFLVLTFTTIFAVKFSFLFLFKAHTRNARKMKIYGWTVVVIITAVWAFGVVEFFLPCPRLNDSGFGAVLQPSLSCYITDTYQVTCLLHSKRNWSAAIVVQDVLTDLMSL